jgi:uncharacterized protein
MVFIKRIEEYLKSHYILLLIVLYIGIVILWHIAHFIFYGIISGLITSALIIIVAKVIGYNNIFGFRKKNILKGLILGFPAIFAGLYSLICSLAYINYIGSLNQPNYSFTAIVMIWLFGAGLFEELFMRGIILNILIMNCKKTKLFSIILSASIFGLSHLYNLINGFEYLIGTISQMLYTIVMGIFFSIIYLKYKNIWSIILIHILFNLMGIIPFALFSSFENFLVLHSIKEIVVIDIIIAILYLLYSFYLYKSISIIRENGT